MPKYRKKPVTIEAQELTSKNIKKIAEWCSGKVYKDSIIIKTLEGDHLASPGDFVIKGIAGEFYPCKPEIFKETYDKV